MEQKFANNQKEECKRIWADWEKEARNQLLDQYCHDCLGDETVNEDGVPVFTYNNISRARPKNQAERNLVYALLEDKKMFNSMNNWLLAEACSIEEPTVNEFITFDSIVLGSSNDKGLFQMRCETVLEKSGKFVSQKRWEP